jgi:hypothetical protein
VIQLLLLFAGNNGWAQIYPRTPSDTAATGSTSSRWKLLWQIETENGGMIPNNRQVKETFHDIFYNAINLRAGWQSQKGGDLYHQRYHYPVYGVGLYASTFRKKEIGTPVAVYGFIAVPIAPERFKRWDFNYRISLGIASNFEPYDAENNPMNILVGSHRNVYIDLGSQINYRLSKHFQLGAGLAFHHFSNGSTRQPNKGINLIPFTLSATYRPTTSPPDFKRLPDSPKKTDNEYHLHYAIGIKQFTPQNQQRFLKSTIGFYRSKSFGYKWRLGLGGDLFYADSGRDPEMAGSKAKKVTALFSGGPALYIDHVLTRNLYLNGNVGTYLHKNAFNGELKPIFLRIGVRHRVFQHYYAGISIKAHTGKADFIEWTIGHTWQRKGKF